MTDPIATSGPRRRLAGTALALRGDDIDTDQIIPGRFLRGTTFVGLGEHVFADSRRACRDRGEIHPFDDPERRGANILLTNRNFGCGSSREHAAQALWRWGIAVVVAESFGEIFADNCVAIGVPCLRVARDDIARLQNAGDVDGSRQFAVDLEEKTIRSGNLVVDIDVSEGARVRLCDGTWDATTILLEAGEAIERTASQLPYLHGWA